MKPIIGIVPQANLFTGDDPYADKYRFVNSYVQRVYATGGTPVGILPLDGNAIAEALALCHGFLLHGGQKLWPYHLEIIDHAAQTCKPVFGICLGMQAICAYFRVLEEAKRRSYAGAPAALFEEMKKERYMFNLPVKGHWLVQPSRADAASAMHPVTVLEGTRLFALLGKREIPAVTLHNYRINGVPAGITINATAADGTIEGIEYGENMLGVQFHPELDATLDALFLDLVEKAGRVC